MKLVLRIILLLIFESLTPPAYAQPWLSYGQASPGEIYGELFHAVQTKPVFEDSKTFPDCIPKFPPTEILAKYHDQKNLATFDLKSFVKRNFNLPEQHARGYHTDTEATVKQHINNLWPVLTRQPDTVQKGSLIPLPNTYIVPGGRFGEIYYWDSYFTMLGLEASGKISLIQNMVDNFSYLIDEYGFIPNGNRTYYLSRSQPPFYSLMVSLLVDIKGDSILVRYLPYLLQEYDFWMKGQAQVKPGNGSARVVKVSGRKTLNRYWDNGRQPRPEAYKEDLQTALLSGRQLAEVCQNIRAACESGWDFSSRWLEDGKTLATIHTTEIVPVDLNALLYHLELTIAKAYGIQGDKKRKKLFSKKAKQRQRAIKKYCWSKKDNFYYDYDFKEGSVTKTASLAALYPLFLHITKKRKARKVAKKIQSDFLFPGGVVTTLNNTGQQWDAPNGWAPLQWITIQGLKNYGFEMLAKHIADNWTQLNIQVFRETGKLVEKYNVVNTGQTGGGGEYSLQDGFGWTNGVLLKLLTNNGK